MGHILSPMGLKYCPIVLSNAEFMILSFQNLQKELVTGFNMQQVHCLGCDRMENYHKFLHPSPDILITSLVIAITE